MGYGRGTRRPRIMKIHLITIGTHMPSWVTSAYDTYAKRLPKSCELILHEIPMPKRQKNTSIEKLKKQEAELISQKIPANNHIIALDEHGKQWTTQQLANDFSTWLSSGQDTVLIIGGPDGLDQSILNKAHSKHALSGLTLPHPLVRVIVAEQIYRAWSILNNHPYHRE